MSDFITLAAKLRLYPTKEQEIQFRKFCGAARFVYNKCLVYRIEMYNSYGTTSSIQDCIKYIQGLKKQEEYVWLKEVPEAVTKRAIMDLDSAYKKFFREKKGFPKFKCKGRCKESFYQRTDRFRQIIADECEGKSKSYFIITGIKKPVKAQYFELTSKAVNPRVSFDGKYWYLTFAYEVEVNQTNGEGVLGVDLGIKNLATVSDGRIYKNINKSKIVKRLEKHKRKLQRQLSRKFEMNKVGNKFVKTNNIIKLQRKIRLLDRRLAAIRNTYIHEVTKDLVKTTPEKIVIEDLNVRGMLKNRHLAKAIQCCEFGKFRTILTYKCKLYGVKLVIANRFYPSSKICSCCGEIKTNLSLSDRTYICDKCGHIMDRDLNASINLRNYVSA